MFQNIVVDDQPPSTQMDTMEMEIDDREVLDTLERVMAESNAEVCEFLILTYIHAEFTCDSHVTLCFLQMCLQCVARILRRMMTVMVI